MIWQDLVFTVGGCLFTLALIPTLRSSMKPPLSTSVLTGIILFAFGLTYLTLGLQLSAISIIVNAGAWLSIAIQTAMGRIR